MAAKHNAEYENSELYKIRHSTAHIMAEAVLEKFPEGKVAIGPAIADGFYYDFEFSHERTLSLLKQECEKTYKRYQNKYHGQELKMRISRFLKQKGYDYEDILIVMDEIWSELND